jgi:hypothetical protein
MKASGTSRWQVKDEGSIDGVTHRNSCHLREMESIRCGDYAMPRADNFCAFALAENEVPTKTNPLGVKGAGESGTVGALPDVVNAINDALARIGAPYVQMPATPEKVWPVRLDEATPRRCIAPGGLSLRSQFTRGRAPG